MTFLAGKKKKTQPGQVGKHIYSPSLLWIWFQTSGPERVALEGHAAWRDPGPRGGRLPGPRRSCRVQDALSRRRDNCRLTGQDGTREVEAGAAVPEEAAASTTAPPPGSTSLFGRDLGGPRWRTPLGGTGGGCSIVPLALAQGAPRLETWECPRLRRGSVGGPPAPPATSIHLHPARPPAGRQVAGTRPRPLRPSHTHTLT